MKRGSDMVKLITSAKLATILVLVALLAPATIRPAASAGKAEAAPVPLAGAMKNFTLSAERKPVPPAIFQNDASVDIDLSAFRGQVVLVNLWATWCAPCRAEMPSLARLETQLGGRDFTVVAIAIDRASHDKVRAFLEETNAAVLKIYTDKSMRSARALGAVGLPTTFLIDREGREVGRLIGPAEWDAPGALALIRHVIAEK